ncbi:MAG: nicotinate phosphoribosyltransferase [Alloprevotella sp.]|nr:nicotinate phosphoribosyltransferase [Alloprevotella sp.]
MIIPSVLDTDLYKFSTSYAYLKLYPDAEGTFSFNDRDKTTYTPEFIQALRDAIKDLSSLRLTPEEKAWLVKHVRYIPEMYWEWLTSFHFDPEKVQMTLDDEQHLHIDVTDKLYKVTLYEVPLLAIVAELRNRLNGNEPNMDEVIRRLDEKIALANSEGLKFSEFGTRRRFSYALHEQIVIRLKEKCPVMCVGTSNVHLAMKYDMVPCGTFPHEWIMFHAACWGYQEANYLGMRDWVRTYDGDLGICLIDTLTTDVFLKNFSRKYAKLFDGVRQDSGDEYEVGNKIIARYEELGIDPTTKTIVFSNALNFPKFKQIASYFKGRVRVSAGIGTNLTNDTGFRPANIVMKLSRCRINQNQTWRKCIKISDDLGKHMGDDKEFEVAKYILGL